MQLQGSFTSCFERIVEFLYRAENINHKDVVYMNVTANTGIFEDKSTGSFVYVEFEKNDKASIIRYDLCGDRGTIHEWVTMFHDEFGASYEATDPKRR